ncbi:MAG: hypothetical protein ACK5AX_20950, partial [Bradyrhizobium sp.]
MLERSSPETLVLRIVRILLLVLLAVLLLPYLVTPFYRTGQPVSALMAWRTLRGAPVLAEMGILRADHGPRQVGRHRAEIDPMPRD